MEYWIFILVLAAIVGVNSRTIVYPGKSALLSYSPARGEFPVESLFGRGYFRYVDAHGISRTINLEPNPLLGVRVGNDGQILPGSENVEELRKDGSLNTRKGDRLKPIKEFDERPFEDKLDEKDLSLFSASIVDSPSKVDEGYEQVKGDQKLHEQILSVSIPAQQEQILFYPKAGSVLAQASGLQPGNAYWTSQIATSPSVQGVINPENPFLNQQLGIPVQSPPATGNLEAVPQNLPPLPGQILFYPPTVSIKPEATPPSSAPISQDSTGQLFLFPLKSSHSAEIVPLSSQSPGINSESQAGETISQGDIINPTPVSSTSSGQLPGINSDGKISSQQATKLESGQATSYPSVPISSVAILPSSNIPDFDSTPSTGPQKIIPNQIAPNSQIPISSILPGNPFFSASIFPSAGAPLQQVFMIQPENPFLSSNKNKDKPVSWPSTTTTISAPLFNVDHKNPFLSNSLNTDIPQQVFTMQVQPIAAKPNPNLEVTLPASIACDYQSVGPAPQQIKDTPEVEKAKREHFLAHELAISQLAQVHQNNDSNNNNEANESSLPLPSASDNSPLYLASLDQPATSGPTTTIEQTTVNAVESDTVTLQPLPV